MNTFNNNIKRIYSAPEFAIIKLDNEISLALASEPPVGPGEPGYIGNYTPDYIKHNPFQDQKT